MSDKEKGKNITEVPFPLENVYFSLINDFLDNLIIILDQKGKIIYYNNACERMTGLAYSEAREMYYWDLFCLSEERELYRSFFLTLESDQYPLEVETQLQDKDGSVSTIMWKYNAFLEQHGEIKYHILNGTDLTNQVKNKKALQELGEKYSAILHASPVSVISIDTNLNIKSWSSATEKLLGWPERVVLGRNIFCFLINDRDKSLNTYFQKSFEGIITKDLELNCLRKDGSSVYVNLSLAPTRDYNGKIDGTVIVAFDITNRKEAEEKILYLSYHDHLTGLYNRYFLEEEMKRLGTDRQLPTAIIMADANGLKLINDIYSHDVGDEMLKSAAEILRNSCRKEDIIARWGGDEFVILLPQITEKDVKVICNRIIDNCRNTYVENIPISFAFGTAINDIPGRSLMTVLQEAEHDMYNKKLIESKKAKNTIISELLKTLELKSFETCEHIQFMQEVALKIGETIGLSQVELDRLKVLVRLHDIGKINITSEILTKENHLTANEWKIIKEHPKTGYRIVRTIEEFSHISEEILSHHECWNGTGYPRGLKGKEIPQLARIVAIADAYEVMKSGRPYKEAFSPQAIAIEFERCAATQFDPELAEVLLQIMDIEK